MLRLPLTDAIHLRLLESSDAEELHALIVGNRGHLSPWMPWAAEPRLDQTRRFIESTRRQVADDDGFQTAIVADGRIIGVVGFHAVDWENRSTGIGYWLAEAHQGRGTMTRAVRALVEHALGPWKLNRVAIEVASENRRSQRVPERLGFKREGTLREAERVGDRYLDSIVYSMLASEWRG